MHLRTEVFVLTAMLRLLQLPDLGHPGAINQHHGGFALVDAEHSLSLHVHIEQCCRVAEINLVDVVVDRAAVKPSECRYGVAIVGEASLPAAPVEAGKVFHQIDLIAARRIPVL